MESVYRNSKANNGENERCTAFLKATTWRMGIGLQDTCAATDLTDDVIESPSPNAKSRWDPKRKDPRRLCVLS